MSKKILLLFVGLMVVLLAGVSWLLLSGNYFGSQPSKNFTINTNPDFISASSLLKEKKYAEAETLFSTLENLKTNTMQDLAFLRLKKLQIFLAENKYTEAADTLENIVTNPQFPRETKARAIENTLTTYLKNSRDSSLLEAIFSRETFRTLRRDTTLESAYSLAQYGYEFQPTTILAANVLYSKIEKAKNVGTNGSTERSKALEEVSSFSKTFFNESDKEIDLLTKQKFQEVALINIYSERSRVIKKLIRLNLAVPNNLSMEEQLANAFKQAELLGDPFYTFYTGFNYIDFMSANKKAMSSEMQESIGKKSIFSSSVVQKQWLTLVTPTPVSSTTVARLAPYSAELAETIEALEK